MSGTKRTAQWIQTQYEHKQYSGKHLIDNMYVPRSQMVETEMTKTDVSDLVGKIEPNEDLMLDSNFDELRFE